MTPATTFRSDERIGLLVAIVLHVAVVAAFLVQKSTREPIPAPERMVVSLTDEVGLTSTAPDPVRESRASVAPTLAPTFADEVPMPVPLPVDAPPPRPVERTVTPAPTRPAPTRTSTPRPQRTASPARETPRAQPSRAAPSRPAARPTTRSGGSRIGDDFLGGAGSSQTSNETRVPASQIGASTQASVVSQLIRQIKPHWSAPQGADADQLVTILAFELDENGRLKGKPRVVSQSGVTDSNAPQKALHAERAIKAVQLAAPFDLPDEYYNAWKSIRGARFDRNL